MPRRETAKTSMPWSNKHGYVQRLKEACWILAGCWSLHRAYQAGLDEGQRTEFRRLIMNKAYLSEVEARTQPAAYLHIDPDIAG